KAPENAKRFAEANQKGGGQSATEQLPQTISETKTPVNEFQVSEELVTSRLQATSPQVEQKRVLTSENQHVTLDVATEPKKGDARKLTAAQLYARSMEIASIDVPLSEKVVEESLGPEKRLAAEAAHHVEAAYRNTWRRKVEQVGKFNFPDLARRLGNSVTLELDVLINSDGTVRDIQILRSSGYQLLDTSAKRIVRLGAPYAPFPEAIQKYTDVLHITYQWRFIPGKGAIGG
ncbi:MAG: energy transducer TonB, partial [Gammaproteobacteria bacterium]|nr:energy transducer TonB [Gammaproteobacteria bacterium]